MKTTQEQRKKLRHTYGGFSEEHNVFLDLLEDLDTQETELTKLRARVALLEEALGFYGSPESWIIRDKDSWRESSPVSHNDAEMILDYCHPNTDWVGTVHVGGKRARQALSESAKIAGE